MSDILDKARAKSAGRVIRDRQDRAEATAAPDARKAREIVRQMGTDSLFHLGQAMARALSSPADRHAMEAAVDGYAVAMMVFAREELKDPSWVLHWMGGFDGGTPRMPVETWPANAPQHKRALAEAWNALLAQVNEATKCGVCRRHRLRPIELVADPDLTLGRSPVVNGASWDD